MPSAKAHDAINLTLTPLVAVGAWQVLGDAGGAALVAGAHVIGTTLLSPDLDLTGGSIDNRWGLLRFIWWPYGKVIKHRSILSHSGLSALLRVAYLAGVLELIGVVLDGLGLISLPALNAAIGAYLVTHWRGVACVLAGLVISDATHTVSDHISTWIKTRGHRGKSYSRVYAQHQRGKERV